MSGTLRNLRTTATADELSPEELLAGQKRLITKVKRYRPRLLAVLGIGAYRTAFQEPRAVLGLQPRSIAEVGHRSSTALGTYRKACSPTSQLQEKADADAPCWCRPKPAGGLPER